MSAVVAVLDVLNAREKASLLWLIVFIAFCAFRSKRDRDLARSLAGLARAFFQWKLQLVFVSALLYCAGFVALAAWIGVLHMMAAKDALYWFFTVGIVLVGRAISHARPFDPKFYRNLLRDAIKLTILFEFLVNLYTFPLLVELILVPAVFAATIMQGVASSSPGSPAQKLFDGILTIIGLALVTYVIVRAIVDPPSIFTRENAEMLLVAPVLTIAFVPLLAALGWISRYERNKLRATLH